MSGFWRVCDKCDNECHPGEKYCSPECRDAQRGPRQPSGPQATVGQSGRVTSAGVVSSCVLCLTVVAVWVAHLL